MIVGSADNEKEERPKTVERSYGRTEGSLAGTPHTHTHTITQSHTHTHTHTPKQ
jgi:hypothetical protein